MESFWSLIFLQTYMDDQTMLRALKEIIKEEAENNVCLISKKIRFSGKCDVTQAGRDFG